MNFIPKPLVEPGPSSKAIGHALSKLIATIRNKQTMIPLHEQPTPETDAHQSKEHMAHDWTWREFAQKLEQQRDFVISIWQKKQRTPLELTDELFELVRKQLWEHDASVSPTPETDFWTHETAIGKNTDGSPMFVEEVPKWFAQRLEKSLQATLAINQHQAAQIVALREALKNIQQLGLGPDRGTVAWQAEAAHDIASKALSTTPPPPPDDSYVVMLGREFIAFVWKVLGGSRLVSELGRYVA